MRFGAPPSNSGASTSSGCWMLSSPRLSVLGAVVESTAQRRANRRTDRLHTRSVKQKQSSAVSPIDIIVGDCRFLHEHTGVDLLTTLAPVKDVHDQVVAALNPIAGGKLAEDLEEGIAELQAELEQAHGEVHELERQLEDTIGYLSVLERNANTLQSSIDVISSCSPSLQKEVQAERQANNSATAPSQPAFAQQPAQSRGGLLRSGLEVPPALRDFWFPAEFSATLKPGESVAFSLFEEPWVLFRDQQGSAVCLQDTCAHRACPLSKGRVVGDCIQCPYHGWEYNGAGECTMMPSTLFRPGLSVKALRVAEGDGLIWVWAGESEPDADIPQVARPPEGFTVHAELLLEVPVEHGLLLENLLDLAHAPFTHTSTFAKGWPIPDIVRFNAAKLLGGNWEPYPIDMSFEPPCMVLSTIGLAQPGKIERGVRAASCKKHLHQLHVCLPAGPGRTRLLYRMSMDFLAWTKHVPFIQRFWASIANQVMGEDLVLVAGQQERMLGGANVWANPVSYDKLGVRYRRWRNSLASGSAAEQEAVRRELYPMAAGELFSLEQP